MIQSALCNYSFGSIDVTYGRPQLFAFCLEQNELFPGDLRAAPKVLILPLDELSVHHGFSLVTKLRDSGIVSDMYPDAAKLKKQMKYADGLGAQYVMIIGESERESGEYTLKEMASGNQETLRVEGLIQRLKH